MKLKTVAILSLCLTFGVTAPGCLVAAIGAVAVAGYGAYAYVKGELKSTEDVSLNKAWAATQAGMKDLEFTVSEKSKDALEAKLVAVKADLTEVTVHLEFETNSSTTFSIRVGTLGDEELSRRVMDTIRKHF